MGDRISIQFVSGSGKQEFKSAVFFSHWDGKDLIKQVEFYLKELKKEAKGKGMMMPLYRMEPGTTMVDFIRYYMRNQLRVESNYYITCSRDEGDNSDNGHFIFHLDTGKVEGGR